MDENIAARLLDKHRDFVGATPLVEVEGLSSPRVCRLLNRLVAGMDRDECYLEVGTWQGLTLLSAGFGNYGRTCIGCDKFRLYGQFTGWGVFAKRALYRNLRRYRGRTADIMFHHTSSRRLFAEGRISSPVGVYFYDGNHSYRGTRHGVVAAAPFLNERCVLLMDDWNDPLVRKATADGLGVADLKTLWYRQLPGDHSKRQWWNGLGVFYVEKGARSPRLKRVGAEREKRPS